MKWPQFELWRLFAATALFGIGFALLPQSLRADGRIGDPLGAIALLSFGTATGIIFRHVTWRVAVVIVLLVTVIVIALLLGTSPGAKRRIGYRSNMESRKAQ